MTFNGGDVFISEAASIIYPSPSGQIPKIWHYSANGTFIEALIIPETIDGSKTPYYALGMAVGSDRKLYVYTYYELTSPFHRHYRLGSFDTDGTWLGYFADLYTDEIDNGNITPCRTGDLFLTRSRVLASPTTDIAKVSQVDGSDIWATVSTFNANLSGLTWKNTITPDGIGAVERVFLGGIVDPSGANYIGAEIFRGSDGTSLTTVDLTISENSAGILVSSLGNTVHIGIDDSGDPYIYTTHIFDTTFTETASFTLLSLPASGGTDGGGELLVDVALSPLGTELWAITFEFTEDPITFIQTYTSRLYHQDLTTGTTTLVDTQTPVLWGNRVEVSPYVYSVVDARLRTTQFMRVGMGTGI